MQKHLNALDLAKQYEFTRPTYQHGWHSVSSLDAVKTVLCKRWRRSRVCLELTMPLPNQATPDTFGVIYSAAIRNISEGDYGFMLGFDDTKQHGKDRALMDGAVFPEGYIDDFTQFYTETMDLLIEEHSWPQTGTVQTLDFVRDCSTMASVYWVARTFGIPLKLNKPGYEARAVSHADRDVRLRLHPAARRPVDRLAAPGNVDQELAAPLRDCQGKA